jgi:hypothetical protein
MRNWQKQEHVCLVFCRYPVRILIGAAATIYGLTERQFPCARVEPLPSSRHSAIRFCTPIIWVWGNVVVKALRY